MHFLYLHVALKQQSASKRFIGHVTEAAMSLSSRRPCSSFPVRRLPQPSIYFRIPRKLRSPFLQNHVHRLAISEINAVYDSKNGVIHEHLILKRVSRT